MDTTPTVYVRKRHTPRAPGWVLHARRDCPALACVADTQIQTHHNDAGAVMDAYSDQAEQQGRTETVFLLCTCMVTHHATRLPTRPPLHARITIERSPDPFPTP